MRITKKDFREHTKLKNIWNTIIEWQGLRLATVQWHAEREWKIVNNNATFDEISDREYKPIAEFHTQEQLWQHIKNNIL